MTSPVRLMPWVPGLLGGTHAPAPALVSRWRVLEGQHLEEVPRPTTVLPVRLFLSGWALRLPKGCTPACPGRPLPWARPHPAHSQASGAQAQDARWEERHPQDPRALLPSSGRTQKAAAPTRGNE